MLNFKQINTVTALIAFILFLVLLIVPQFIFYIFQIETHESPSFMSRRAAFLFLGFTTLLYLSKDIIGAELQKPIILCVTVSMLGLSSLGLFEYFRGFVGLGIFLAITIELFITTNYLILLKKLS